MRNQKQIWLSNILLVLTCQFSGWKMCCKVWSQVLQSNFPLPSTGPGPIPEVSECTCESYLVLPVLSIYFHSLKYRTSLGSYSSWAIACTFSDVFLSHSDPKGPLLYQNFYVFRLCLPKCSHAGNVWASKDHLKTYLFGLSLSSFFLLPYPLLAQWMGPL